MRLVSVVLLLAIGSSGCAAIDKLAQLGVKTGLLTAEEGLELVELNENAQAVTSVLVELKSDFDSAKAALYSPTQLAPADAMLDASAIPAASDPGDDPEGTVDVESDS
ncbi:MAG: hypothetical protein AAF581_09905 [Planctomycetota bacterium]